MKSLSKNNVVGVLALAMIMIGSFAFAGDASCSSSDDSDSFTCTIPCDSSVSKGITTPMTEAIFMVVIDSYTYTSSPPSSIIKDCYSVNVTAAGTEISVEFIKNEYQPRSCQAVELAASFEKLFVPSSERFGDSIKTLCGS